MPQLLRVAKLALVLGLMPAFATTVRAGLLDQLTELGSSAAGTLGLGKSKHEDAASLNSVISRVQQLPPSEQSTALAVGATDDGHWRLANAGGEIMTVASPTEWQRAVAILLPDAAARPELPLAVYLTEATAFQFRSQLKALPANSRPFLVVGADSYPLVLTEASSVRRVYARLRPNVLIELEDKSAFDVALELLRRPLDRTRIRIITLESGAAQALRPRPTPDAATGQPAPDHIVAAALIPSLGALSGQTAVITGRVSEGRLLVQPSGGEPTALSLRDLTAAAMSADVSLIIVEATQQPGARTWMFRRTEVEGLDLALAHSTLLDFYNGLGETYGRLAITARPTGAARLQLDAVPLDGIARTALNVFGAGEILSQVVTQVTGKVSAAAIRGDFVSPARQDELARRIVPGIPSPIQFIYLALLLSGLLAARAAWRWWGRVWPAERRADYSGMSGYQAARALRAAVFAIAVLPLSAPLLMLSRRVRRGEHTRLRQHGAGTEELDRSATTPN